MVTLLITAHELCSVDILYVQGTDEKPTTYLQMGVRGDLETNYTLSAF